MSPTIFCQGGFRFFFFSREETRMHVHVAGAHGEAKFWLEPKIELGQNYKLTSVELAETKNMITEHEHEIRNAWGKHFGS